MFAVCVCVNLTLLFRHVYPADAAVSSCESSGHMIAEKFSRICKEMVASMSIRRHARIDRTQNLGRHWQCMRSQYMLSCCCRSFHHEHRRSLFHSKSASTDVIIHFRRAKAHGKRIWRMLRRFKFIFECSLYKR